MAIYLLINVAVATLALPGGMLLSADLKPRLSSENDDKKLQWKSSRQILSLAVGSQGTYLLLSHQFSSVWKGQCLCSWLTG